MATRFLPFLPVLLLLLVNGVAPAVAGNMEDFGSCLTRSGATFYGATWCPICRRQSQTLGEAMRRVRYVECADASEPKRSTSECNAAKIDGYPTWVFGDGSRAEGALSLASLARRSGCPLPAGAIPDAPPPPNRPAVPRGHVKIIEVPQC